MTRAPEHLTNFSRESIEMSYELQMQWFDEQVCVAGPMVPGFEQYGDVEQTIYRAPYSEVQKVMQRMQQLEDLMTLSKPVYSTTWGPQMAAGHCPCMTNRQWAEMCRFYEDETDQPTVRMSERMN